MLAVDDVGFAWRELAADTTAFRDALSFRQRRVLALMVDGFPQAAIARRLKIRRQTVSEVVHSIKQKHLKFFPEAR